MIVEVKRTMARREFLRRSLVSTGLSISGIEKLRWREFSSTWGSSAIHAGAYLGVVEFSDEGAPPMGTAIGTELDGRLFTDLSRLTPEDSMIPGDTFYIRTRASKLLDTKTWSIQVEGGADRPIILSVPDLEKMTRPMGLHLMECAGNTRSVHFGMLSVASWDGVPLLEVLGEERLKQPLLVLVSGFDRYASASRTSWAGASWIFSVAQLESTRAFLATKMNGQELSLDHGAPVRLVVPGWYGCTCIKWVNQISLVAEVAAATSQMEEYASRTMQPGMPLLAQEYHPAVMDLAAMPVRVEKWTVRGKIEYFVVGIQGGGSRPIEGLEIQFNPEEAYLPVTNFQIRSNGSWNFWSHVWVPQKTGKYAIRLRPNESANSSSRLNSGYYVRSVEITEI